MVYLNRIYTRSGDGGVTSLGDGTRVSKTHPRIAAYGACDELNSLLGVALTLSMPDDIVACLKRVQNDLFDLGADLCVPEAETPSEHHPPLRVTAHQVASLEEWIDRINDGLSPLRSFVLPGGVPAASYLHLARTVCRRAEIEVLHLGHSEKVSPHVPIYLNRLSDLLFVAARACNLIEGVSNEVLWVPGSGRSE